MHLRSRTLSHVIAPHLAVATALLLAPAALLLAPATAGAAETLLPAGSIIQCTVSEPKISSKVDKIGDPILCQVSHVELYGRSTIPYGSYLVGHFENFKDPGHFVGKGWIELRFDRLVIQPDTVVPMDARVISAPKYPVDSDGRIHGTGHAVRDTIEWFIPVLWPIDLINLPRRGPRVVLKAESRLTLKVMDDVGIPQDNFAEQQPAHRPALITRQPQPQYSQNEAPPQGEYYPQQNYAPAPVRNYAPPTTIIYNNYPPPQPPQQVVIVQQAAPRRPPPPVVYGYYAPRPYAYGPYGPPIY